jgi:hypothetical protein
MMTRMMLRLMQDAGCRMQDDFPVTRRARAIWHPASGILHLCFFGGGVV